MFFNKKKADVEPTVAKPSEDTTKVAESSAEAVNDASKTKKEETSKDSAANGTKETVKPKETELKRRDTDQEFDVTRLGSSKNMDKQDKEPKGKKAHK